MELLAPGSGINYAFSVASLLLGFGAVTWSLDADADRADERIAEGVKGAIPIAAFLCSTVAVLSAPRIGDGIQLIHVSGTAVMMLAMIRQSVLVAEQRRAVGRQRDGLEREREAADTARRALEAQVESQRRYRAAVETFNRLGEQMAFAMDEAELVDAGESALRRLVPTEAGDILLLNASQNRLTAAAAWGPSAREVGRTVDFDSPTRCPGIRGGSTYSLPDGADPTFIHCPAHRIERGSLLCIPLGAIGQTVGVIHLERAETNAFDSEAAGIAERIGEQLALSTANARLVRRLEGLAMTDPLTGLHNARFFDPYLDAELAVVKRDLRPLGIVMIDVDHFKAFNDNHGHPAGDEALRTFARAVVGLLRESDVIARYGGEEFVVAVHNADLAATAHVAEKIRQASEAIVVDIGPGRFGRITVSCGVGSTAAHGTERLSLLRTADRALYRAKERGRNRVELGEDPEAAPVLAAPI